ncbi:alpha/beta hydrolase family protein [Deinococcus aquiradiocola]|uniref:Alpha/beta hydrolase n=1 Tax=Deinococcus aquiradiocola TaxID=393059 RepID=A0A917UM00_9DEIO|nr:alpha/beta hydrolase [Deinococcus aquiradiocola]GGJ67190.1 alpha/beta hydrolase [Deinococcus aquiradiocola]
MRSRTPFVLSFCLLLGTAASERSSAVTARSLTLNFAGIPARAELLLPDRPARAPLVLLIQGTGPEDMDGSFATFGGQVTNGSLGTLAHALAGQGYAVMRFDKRYARESLSAEGAVAAYTAYGKLSMRDLLSDARTALNAAAAQPDVDASRVYVYGWSEGSVIAATLALEVGARGLIVQGPVANDYASVFARQFGRVGVPYLSRYAQDGRLGLPGLLSSFGGNGSMLAKLQGQLLFDRTSTLEHPVLNTAIDVNHDGMIDLQAEALPAMAAYDRASVPQDPMYAPSTSLPTLDTLTSQLKLPVLILQGGNDANIDPADARTFDTALTKAGNTDHTLKLYPGLGHSLGKAADVTQDDFAPMEKGPMNDMVNWLNTH